MELAKLHYLRTMNGHNTIPVGAFAGISMIRSQNRRFIACISLSIAQVGDKTTEIKRVLLAVAQRSSQHQIGPPSI